MIIYFSHGLIHSIQCVMWVSYHPTSGLMQILRFDWLRYYRSRSNSHRVAKFAGFVNLFISFYSQINIFLTEFIIAFFCPTSWVILKQLDPSPSRATDQWPIRPRLMG